MEYRGPGVLLHNDLKPANLFGVDDIDAVTYEHRAGGDWFDVYRDRIRADIQRL